MALHRKSPRFRPKAKLKDGKKFHQEWPKIKFWINFFPYFDPRDRRMEPITISPHFFFKKQVVKKYGKEAAMRSSETWIHKVKNNIFFTIPHGENKKFLNPHRYDYGILSVE